MFAKIEIVEVEQKGNFPTGKRVHPRKENIPLYNFSLQTSNRQLMNSQSDYLRYRTKDSHGSTRTLSHSFHEIVRQHEPQ